MSIKALREAAGLTREELAEALSVTKVAVYYWETGMNKPRAAKLIPMAKLLNCSVEELLS